MGKEITYKLTRYFCYIGYFALLLNSLLGIGDGYDEVEHCHAAWLIGKAGLLPIRDFFQHHQPILWDLLKLYYLFGGDGPEVLYFGRVLVCIAVLAIIVSLTRMARPQPPERPLIYSGALAVSLIFATQKLLPTVFVIRPETVGGAFALTSVFLWTRNRTGWLCAHPVVRDIAAGIFFGLSVYSSARFILFAGIYLLLNEGNLLREFRVYFSRYFVFVAAALAAVVAYSQVSRVPLRYFAYELSFSAHLQHVGTTTFSAVRPMEYLFAFAAIVLLFVFWLLPQTFQLRYLLMLLYCLGAVAITVLSWGNFPYGHNCVVPLLLATIVIAWAESRLRWNPFALRSATVAVSAIVVLFVVMLEVHAARHQSIIGAVTRMHGQLDYLRPGDRVLLSSLDHPISAPDASYYGLPLGDFDNRTCLAVATYRSNFQLPPCSYLEVTRTRPPVMIDKVLLRNDASLHIQRGTVVDTFGHTYREINDGIYLLDRQ